MTPNLVKGNSSTLTVKYTKEIFLTIKSMESGYCASKMALKLSKNGLMEN